MFKFKGISSEDMQVIIEEEEHFIARASQRYETIEIEGRDGAIFNELGYSVVERPIYVQCLNINKIDDILAWLNGEGEFEYKGRKTTARFYSQLEPQRSSCIRIIDTTFIRDPFWYKANEKYIIAKERKDKTAEGETIDLTDSAEMRLSKLNISGNSKQETRSGKNKLELTDGTYEHNGVTGVVKDGVITLNGTATDGTSFLGINLLKSIDLTSENTYHLSAFNTKTIGDGTNYCALRLNQENIQVLFNEVNTNGSISNTDLKVSYITIRTQIGVTYDNFVVKPQLELGDGTDTFEQYGVSPSPEYSSEIKTVSGSVEINVVNKNWFKNYEKKEINNFGIKLNIDKNVLKFDGSVSSTNYPSFRFYADGSIETNQFWAGKENINGAKGFFDNNTINKVFSLFSTGTLSTTSSVKIRLTIGYETQLKNVDVYNFKNILSVLSDVNERINFIAIGFSPNTNVLLTASMQIETGTTATDFIEHQSQSAIMPVQKEMLTDDYFDWDNEEEVHTWNKLVLTGNENLILDDTYKGIAQFSVLVNALYIYDNNIRAISNYFKGVFYSLSWKKNNTVTIIGTGSLRFMTNKYTSVDDFKAWLKTLYNAGTPVIVYYKLQTPTRLAFTDEQKAVAKELNNARTYKNITHMYSTDNVSPNIEVTYFTPTNETINNEGNIQSRPILRLEKTVSEAVELTINDIRFKYNFKDDEYVEIDCEEKTVEYEGLNRNRQITIGYDYPKLNIGSNKITMHDGDCIIKILRKDRWL